MAVAIKEKAFNSAYKHFKAEIVAVRNNLKQACTEEELFDMREKVENMARKATDAYDRLRLEPEIDQHIHQRRIDTVTACTSDIVSLINTLVTELEVSAFDAVERRLQLKTLKQPYAASVYSARTSINYDTSAHMDTEAPTIPPVTSAAQYFVPPASIPPVTSAAQYFVPPASIPPVTSATENFVPPASIQTVTQAPWSNTDIQQLAIGSLQPTSRQFGHTIPTPTQSSTSNEQQRDLSLAQAIAHAMDRNRLPIPTPKPFSGDPIEYSNFKRSFKTLVENKAVTAEEKIYYLEQYLCGDAKRSVAGCFYGTEETDYQQAWRILEERFGHPFKIQEAFREKLDAWPKLHMKDNVGLQRYADFLKTCLNAMPHIRGLQVLNDCKENQKMVAKLPDPLISRWSRTVTDHLDATHDYPQFEKFASFVEREARVACNPVSSFAAIKTSSATSHHKEEKSYKAHNLSTSIKEPKPSNQAKECPYCKGSHYLPNCSIFEKTDNEEKVTYIKRTNRCFGCLRTGHITKNCPSRHTCQRCKKPHPTVLHCERAPLQPTPQVNNLQEEESSALTTYGGSAGTSHILPVWVSTKDNPRAERLVYALLDTQSDSTFIQESVCTELAPATQQVKLKLSTMSGKGISTDCQRATGLRVRGYTSSQFIDLPPAYTKDFIPFNKAQVPTCETAKQWNHLVSIAQELPSLLDIEVGLVIGHNCSHALIPRRIVTGQNCEPYAMKTDLGWSILGSPSQTSSPSVCYRTGLKENPRKGPGQPRKPIQGKPKDGPRQPRKFLEGNTKGPGQPSKPLRGNPRESQGQSRKYRKDHHREKPRQAIKPHSRNSIYSPPMHKPSTIQVLPVMHKGFVPSIRNPTPQRNQSPWWEIKMQSTRWWERPRPPKQLSNQ